MAKIITPQYALELQYAPLENRTDEELLHFCEQNDVLRIERDEHHQLSIMPPVASEMSIKNCDIITDLNIWNRKWKLGISFGSSAGFYLPDGSMKSPDAA